MAKSAQQSGMIGMATLVVGALALVYATYFVGATAYLMVRFWGLGGRGRGATEILFALPRAIAMSPAALVFATAGVVYAIIGWRQLRRGARVAELLGLGALGLVVTTGAGLAAMSMRLPQPDWVRWPTYGVDAVIGAHALFAVGASIRKR